MARRAAGGDELADLIELEILVAGRSFGVEDLRRRIELHGRVSARNMPLAVRQMAWRAKVLGPGYPFTVGNNSIELREKDALHEVYAALLLMTPGVLPTVGCIRDDPTHAVVLEKLACAALVGLLGPGTKAIRFGWPSDSGRPPEFSEAIKWLAAAMGMRAAPGYRPPRRKDGGVDVVAWRSFSDNRPGFPVVLAQCSIEREFSKKVRDVDVRQWSDWLSLEAHLIVALVVPGALPFDEQWNEIVRNCVILERMRLMSLVSLGPAPDVGAAAKKSIAELSTLWQA